MNGKRRATKVVTGLHIVKKSLPAGVRFYVYAWRGGPCIHKQDGTYPTVTPAILAKQMAAFAKDRQRTPDGAVFETVITAYRDSPEFASLADSTQRDYRLWLDRISAKFGDAPLAAFNDRKMRGEIILFRDTWKDTPRTADKASVMMSTLLGFAVERSMLDVNVAARIKQLHKTTKADQIWEEEHWIRFNAADPPQHLMDALFVDSLTGLRLSDLVAVKWTDVYPTAIKMDRTQKKKSRAVIPILPELRTWLDKQEDKTGTILKNSRGYAWTASGLGSVFQKKQPQGFDRTIHDLRGTFATRLIVAGFTDEQAAMVLGWTAKRIAAVRARYVDEERVILSLAEKLSA